MKSRTAIVIGGGVIGLSTAYQLARRGYGRIIVLEKDQLGEGSSSRAAGISTGLLWSETGVKARQVSLQLFRELSQDLEGYDFHHAHGCLNLFSPALWTQREHLLPMYDRLGAPYQVLTAAEIRHRWSDFNPDDQVIGLHDPMGGYSEPPDYIEAMARRLGELGVEIREQVKVTGFVRSGRRVTGVEAAGTTIAGDAVVCTVHAWTLPVLKSLNFRLPVKHFVHQRYLTAPTSRTWNFPPVNADIFGGYFRPAFGNRLLMGVETAERNEWQVTSTDFHMSELFTSRDVQERAVERFKHFLPAMQCLAWESAQVGLISFSMDGEPVLGPVSAVPGLFVGLAFHSGGFSYNPVAGLLLAEYIMERKTSIDVSTFLPDRFAPEQVEAHLKTVLQQHQAVHRRH